MTLHNAFAVFSDAKNIGMKVALPLSGIYSVVSKDADSCQIKMLTGQILDVAKPLDEVVAIMHEAQRG